MSIRRRSPSKHRRFSNFHLIFFKTIYRPYLPPSSTSPLILSLPHRLQPSTLQTLHESRCLIPSQPPSTAVSPRLADHDPSSRIAIFFQQPPPLSPPPLRCVARPPPEDMLPVMADKSAHPPPKSAHPPPLPRLLMPLLLLRRGSNGEKKKKFGGLQRAQKLNCSQHKV
ncbi:unnamed protein product [Linum trigynum]|uniref:Uncharacterized protein n=1 Tax=Linum trigynum TaxID=586398 RepID=A0AAV2E0E5_9ROSI